MSEERTLFERLDSIEATNESTNRMIAEILGVLQNGNVQKATTQTIVEQPKLKNEDILKQFLKEAIKSWRFFGTKAELAKWKVLAIVSFIFLLVIGLITSIVSTICFKVYSTFTLFENVWMIFGIIYLVFASKSKLTYEVNALASNSSYKYVKDEVGMMFAGKERVVFRIFKWLAIISAICNIICIWAGVGKTNRVLATIMELLFLSAIVFSFFMNLHLFAHYSIIWIEGHNLDTREKVVLVLLPGAKQLIPEEEFKKLLPQLYE